MRGGKTAHPLRLRLQRAVLHHREAAAERIAHAAGALLHHMGELVAEQLLAPRGLRLEAARRVIDVGAQGEGDGADALGLWADMDADGGKVGAEGCPFLAAHRVRQWPAAAGGEAEAAGIDGESRAGVAGLGDRRFRRERRRWWAGPLRLHDRPPPSERLRRSARRKGGCIGLRARLRQPGPPTRQEPLDDVELHRIAPLMLRSNLRARTPSFADLSAAPYARQPAGRSYFYLLGDLQHKMLELSFFSGFILGFFACILHYMLYIAQIIRLCMPLRIIRTTPSMPDLSWQLTSKRTCYVKPLELVSTDILVVMLRRLLPVP
jgi:hypothetical protein